MAPRPSLLGGHTCGTRRSQHSIESEMGPGSLWLGRVMGRSGLRPRGSVVSLGTGSFVCGHAGKPCSPGAASKARVAAGVVGKYHFAGVKLLVFCPFFILVGFSLKTCTGSVLVFNTGQGGCCGFFLYLRSSFQPCLAQGEVLIPQEPGRFLGVQ